MNRCYSQATPSSSPSYNFLHNLLCFMEGEQCFSTHIVNRVFFTQALRALPGPRDFSAILPLLAGPWLLPESQRTLSLLLHLRALPTLSWAHLFCGLPWRFLVHHCLVLFLASPSLTSYPPFPASFRPPFSSFPSALRQGNSKVAPHLLHCQLCCSQQNSSYLHFLIQLLSSINGFLTDLLRMTKVEFLFGKGWCFIDF